MSGSTPAAPAADRRPVAWAFIVIVAVLALWSAPALLNFKVPPVSVIKGEVVRAFEKHYDEAFPLRLASINLWTAAQLKLFGEGRPGVILGRDGWLYSAEEFGVLDVAAPAFEANVAFIAWAQRQLAAAGVPLVIAIVPQKARVYADHLGSRHPLAIHDSITARLQERLAASGVPVIDLLPVLSAGRADGDTYLRTDTHWTPRGAELAANAIVERLQALGLISPTARPQDYRIERDAETEHRGDLLSFLPLEPMFPSLMPPLDRIIKAHTVVSGASAPGDDLLGDGALPSAVLIGTSYSANPNWNFPGFLEARLGETLAKYAKEGVGPMPPMAGYLLGDDLKQLKPRVVIWEIPERALLSPPLLDTYHLPPEATGHAATKAQH